VGWDKSKGLEHQEQGTGDPGSPTPGRPEIRATEVEWEARLLSPKGESDLFRESGIRKKEKALIRSSNNI